MGSNRGWHSMLVPTLLEPDAIEVVGVEVSVKGQAKQDPWIVEVIGQPNESADD